MIFSSAMISGISSHSSCCQTAEHSSAWDFLLFVPCYTIGRTMSTFNPRASMMRKNIPTPGSITPFSMREI